MKNPIQKRKHNIITLKNFFKIIILCSLLMTSGCFYFFSPLRKANKALNEKNCQKAREFFSLSTTKNTKKKLTFARKATKTCSLLSLEETIWFYNYLFKTEKSLLQKLFFKEKLANLYFDQLKNYEKALEGYHLLKNLSVQPEKKFFYSFRIALAYFDLKKLRESLKETDIALNLKPNNLEVYFLKARIFLMQAKYEEAKKILRYIQKTDLDFFHKNNLLLYLSFIYESRKEFHKAISELNKFKHSSDFLTDKINRLKIRQKNQPLTRPAIPDTPAPTAPAVPTAPISP